MTQMMTMMRHEEEAVVDNALEALVRTEENLDGFFSDYTFKKHRPIVFIMNACLFFLGFVLSESRCVSSWTPSTVLSIKKGSAALTVSYFNLWFIKNPSFWFINEFTEALFKAIPIQFLARGEWAQSNFLLSTPVALLQAMSMELMRSLPKNWIGIVLKSRPPL